MKLSVGSNSQRGPRHGEAAGFLVLKDFSGEKERNGSNFIKAGEGGKEEGRRVHKERYTHRRRRIVAADLASSEKEGSKEGRKDEPKEEGRAGTKISFQGQRSPRSAFISGALPKRLYYREPFLICSVLAEGDILLANFELSALSCEKNQLVSSSKFKLVCQVVNAKNA